MFKYFKFNNSIFIISIAVLLILILAPFNKGKMEEQVEIDAVVATVNGENIIYKDVIKVKNSMRLKKYNDLTNNNEDKLTEAAIEQRIIHRLLIQEAQRLNIEVSDEEVAIQLQLIKEVLPSDLTLEESLILQNYTEDALLAEIKEQLMIERLLLEYSNNREELINTLKSDADINTLIKE
ncbi:SurA N-terminal domain-containing protein [Evansella cellulosilytica]|uniref:Uncharacterized protein n=1 Tax=Evansella cellulosilytica (strain ATCC 21833 / DSM 2522 / FERM P-1141 / JCM 9156 / N-4) TaxID=649639 RepID=E6TYN9_EVAC2|nr:SurA N-terminal domain-containing protein [Evansella cellulosilytica]ADU30089.1 hypothetical protein Bcell_1827 [Evansella cellulosilytica DSM 2522]